MTANQRLTEGGVGVHLPTGGPKRRLSSEGEAAKEKKKAATSLPS